MKYRRVLSFGEDYSGIATVKRVKENSHRVVNKALENNNGKLFGNIISSNLEAFSNCNLLNFSQREQIYFMKSMVDFGAASFKCIMNPEKNFSFTLNGQPFEMIGSYHSAHTDAHKWLDCIYAAIAVRNEEAINVLMQVPTTVFDNAAVKDDPITYALANVYKGLFVEIQDRSMLELITIAYSVADSDRADRLEYIMSNMLPQLGIIRSILSPDNEDEYNNLMKEAVLTHKDYWSQDEYAYRGWVSLPLIALASVAFDHKGYRLNFETDYIPRWLVEREFS